MDVYRGKIEPSETKFAQWVDLDDVTENKCKMEGSADLGMLRDIQVYKCNLMLQKIMQKIGKRVMIDKEDQFKVWNEEMVFGSQELAIGFGDLVMTMIDVEYLDKCAANASTHDINEQTLEMFGLLARTNAAMNIVQDIGTFYKYGYLSPEQGEALQDQIKADLPKLEKFSVALVNCYQPPEELMDCMIAPSNGELYKSIQRRMFSQKDAFARISNWKELALSIEQAKL